MKIQSAIAIITTLVSAVDAGKNTTQAPTPTVTRPVDETTPPLTPFPTESTPMTSPPESTIPETSPPVRACVPFVTPLVDCLYRCACIRSRSHAYYVAEERSERGS